MGNKTLTYEYDPIKKSNNGDIIERTVWSTASLNAAVEGLKRGEPLKANPFIGKNTKLLRPDLVYKRTKEEIDDTIRCMQDILYFASKCYLMTPSGLKPCVLRDYQKDYLLHLKKNRFSIFLSCRQSGKSTTTAIYCLWVILFNPDKSGLILSKSGPAGVDLLSKIKDMFMFLPYHLKCGVKKWNQHEISFDNNSKIETEAFSPTAGLGKTINFLILDEFAWCPSNEVDLFYSNVIPTITADTNANICIMSTQNGFNLFYKLYNKALKGENIYAPFKVDWNQVPEWDATNKTWVPRTEEWKRRMIGVLGSEEDFYYQYGTQFSISNYCIVSRETMARIHSKECLFRSIVDNDNMKWNEMHDNGIELTLQYNEYLYINPKYDISRLKTQRFVILADLAEGGGGDFTVFHILEVLGKESFEQVGYWRSNKVDIEHAALEFWLLICQLFNKGNALISIEWNTYGALFYQYIRSYNEPDYDEKSAWRYNTHGTSDGVDMDSIIQYKKDTIESQSLGKRTTNTIPGIRFSSANKHVACSLLKILLEKSKINIYDIETITELENFEDRSGNGSYAAKIGHDDIVMTLCQIPMIQQTTKFNDFIEEMQTLTSSSPEDFINIYDATYQTFGLNPMTGFTNPFMNNNYSDDLY